MRSLRGWLVVAAAVVAVGVLAEPAVGATEPDPDEVAADAVLQADGVAWLAQTIDSENPDSVTGSLGIGAAHAVHCFSDAYVRGDATAPVLGETVEWVAVWTRSGTPAGLIRVWRPSDRMELAGVDWDEVTAGAVAAWDGSGALVEEPWRARWFVLEGTTLSTLSGPSYSDSVLAASYDTRTYAADVAAYLEASQDMPGVWLGPVYLGPPGVVITIVAIALMLLAGVAIAVSLARRRTA
ncbi:MAG: hypothetical protein KQH57_05225 [Actinomycetales bacterium]|nr:hypothetical protein [Actinomycetales bacterium]